MSNITYKLVVEADEQEVHSVVLDSRALDALVGQYHEGEGEFVLGYLAQSPSSAVRGSVASHISTNEDTLELLAKDESVKVRQKVVSRTCNEDILELLAKDEAVDVRRSIVSNDKFQAWATTEIVIDHIRSDIECAKAVAGTLGEFTDVDYNEIAEVLRNHPDPEVRIELAENFEMDEEVLPELLKELLTDPEHSVRSAARNTLDYVLGYDPYDDL